MTKAEVNPTELLKVAISIGRWRYINDSEQPAAVAALAAVVGKTESKLPSLQRRLAVTADGSRFLLVIENCVWKEPSEMNWRDYSPEACRGTPTALPLAEAVALLNSPANPEVELARRRALASTREAAEAERTRVAAAKLQAENAERARIEQERIDCRADVWVKLTPLQQLAARVGLAVAERDPKLAADIRAAADASPDAFPRGAWWTGFDNFMEAQRVAAVLATIPAETRTVLKIQHGNIPAKIVAAFEALQAQKRAEATPPASRERGRAA